MKRQALRRLLSGFLAAVMVAALLPVTAMAASEPTGEALKWVNDAVDEINGALPEGSNQYISTGWSQLGTSDLYCNVYTRTVVIPGQEISFDSMVFIMPGNEANSANCAMPDYESLPTLWGGSNASQIFIGAGVTGIGSNAFVGMDTVDQVTFQDASDLTYVGENAFSGLSSAAFTDEGNQDDPGTLDLSHVTRLGSYAFSGCSQIDGVMLGGSITAVETPEDGVDPVVTPNKIPKRAFSGVQLDTVTIPEGITEIGVGAFAGNRAASAISLPSTLVTIGDEAFACSIDGNNEGVRELTIPEKVSYIGTNAFYGFTGLQTVTVESELLTSKEQVGSGAFGNDASSAFYGTQRLPDGVELKNSGTIFELPANVAEAGTFWGRVNFFFVNVRPPSLE